MCRAAHLRPRSERDVSLQVPTPSAGADFAHWAKEWRLSVSTAGSATGDYWGAKLPSGLLSTNGSFRDEFERTLTTEIMKDCGRLQAYANPSNAGTRRQQAVGYGYFGFWPPECMRNARSGA
ncbi:hypothetical protein GCM10010989_05890 [Croceicoccus pelagius]|uniref:Uncharacterized protein n=1 Tax=Croceicoccus pelagius TaxID=1703341 RepID=A0A916Y7U5_9SPHN|nr:hypothetical protein GCM10010989_05890 [Croceicoccus pelagius]